MIDAPPPIAERAAGRARLFGVSLTATVLVTLAIPLPWRLSGIAFALVTLYAGLRLLADLVRLRRSGHRAPGWLGVAAGLTLAGFALLLLAGQAALYPLIAEEEHCTATAITHADEAGCRAAFEERQAELLRRLQGGPVPTGS